jgi:hypothetical protein
VNAAAKDAELYLRRCRKLEAVIADLLAALERIENPPQTEPGPLREVLSAPYEDCRDIARAAIAKARGEL